MTPAAMAARRSVFLTSSRDLLQPVPEIADSVLAQLIDLHAHPTPRGAERLAMELDGVRRHCLKIKQALENEAAGRPATA